MDLRSSIEMPSSSFKDFSALEIEGKSILGYFGYPQNQIWIFFVERNGAENQLAQDNQRDRPGARTEAYSVPDLHSTCRGTGAQGRH